jgi:hypothetical protein
MAIKAATRKVLSPTSEKRIIASDSKKEWSGWIKPSVLSPGMSSLI